MLHLRLRNSVRAVVGSLPVLCAVSGASGLLLAWSFPPAGAGWLAGVALAPTLALLIRRRAVVWGFAGLLVGAAWYGTLPSSLLPMWGTAAALGAYLWAITTLGVVFGLAGLVACGLSLSARPFALAGVWPLATLALSFYLRTPHGLALAAADDPWWPALGLCRVLGARGLDAVLLLLSGSVAVLLGRPAAWRWTIVGLCLAGATLVLGSWAPTPVSHGSSRVAGLQPNIATEAFRQARWSLYERRRIEAELDRHTRAALQGAPGLVVWPEGANGLANRRLRRRRALLQAMLERSQAELLVSGREITSAGSVRNAASHVTSRGFGAELLKAVAVPLVEAEIETGPPRVIQTGQGRVGLAICFDALFEHHVAALAAQDAELVVVISDDASFGRSTLPFWHQAYARLWGATFGKPVVFVSNAGPSAASGPDGRTIAGPLELLRGGTLEAQVPRVPRSTWAASAGRWIPPSLSCVFVLWVFVRVRRRRRVPTGCQRNPTTPTTQAQSVRPRLAGVAKWLLVSTGLVISLLGAAAAGIAVAQIKSGQAPSWSALARRVERGRASPGRQMDALAPLFLQSGQRTCGAAALAYALTSLGAEVFEEQIVASFDPPIPDGLTMVQLAREARRRGFAAVGLTGTLAHLEQLGGALALAHYSIGHYVVVIGREADAILLFDPAFGRVVRVPESQFARLWSGHYVRLAPAELPLSSASP